jgi:hypothetical protein
LEVVRVLERHRRRADNERPVLGLELQLKEEVVERTNFQRAEPAFGTD